MTNTWWILFRRLKLHVLNKNICLGLKYCPGVTSWKVSGRVSFSLMKTSQVFFEYQHFFITHPRYFHMKYFKKGLLMRVGRTARCMKNLRMFQKIFTPRSGEKIYRLGFPGYSLFCLAPRQALWIRIRIDPHLFGCKCSTITFYVGLPVSHLCNSF